MSVIILATMLVLQDADVQAVPQGSEPPAPESNVVEQVPDIPPTDAATLIAEFDATYSRWGNLIAEMAARKARDRFIRDLLLSRISRTDLDPGARSEIIRATGDTFDAVDNDNTAWAISLLDELDFAALNHDQPRLAADIAALIQHGDHATQQRLLQLVEPLALAGEFSGQRYALLFDRVAVAEDHPQRYGSQFQCENGEIVYAPLEDPETVDETRNALNLEPLATYRERTNELYGASCRE